MMKHLTRDDASKLLERIQSYWAERGYDVNGMIVAAGYSERLRSTVYEIKTDLVIGYPSQRAA